MKLNDYIQNSQKILIVGHIKPDGDSLGSGLALLSYAKKLNKQADLLYDSVLPDHYSFLTDFNEINKQKLSDYDTFITVDCADKTRLGKYVGYLKIRNSINIDHHHTNDNFAAVNIVDRNACSTCEIVFGLLDECNGVDATIAANLFVGLSTDTGHFMHSNISAKVFEICSKLIGYGINASEIATNLYKNNTYNKTKLISKAIESMKFFHDDDICVISIFLDTLKECNCEYADTEGLIDYAMNIKGVKVAVCVCEQNRPPYKVSYRSRGFDVASAAAVFGGGGHVQAAGCVVNGHYEDVIRKIVKSITDGMD